MPLAAPLASLADLAKYMRKTFTTTEGEQAYLTLQVVSAWARTEGKKNWNSSDTLPPDDVVGVVLSAARREMTNPDRVISQSMGPMAVTYEKAPIGFFTAGELAILRKKSSGSLYTVSTRREDEWWGMGYLHMREDLSDDPFPYLNYGEPGWEGTVHP
jgi:hypothetical protein